MAVTASAFGAAVAESMVSASSGCGLMRGAPVTGNVPAPRVSGLLVVSPYEVAHELADAAAAIVPRRPHRNLRIITCKGQARHGGLRRLPRPAQLPHREIQAWSKTGTSGRRRIPAHRALGEELRGASHHSGRRGGFLAQLHFSAVTMSPKFSAPHLPRSVSQAPTLDIDKCQPEQAGT